MQSGFCLRRYCPADLEFLFRSVIIDQKTINDVNILQSALSSRFLSPHTTGSSVWSTAPGLCLGNGFLDVHCIQHLGGASIITRHTPLPCGVSCLQARLAPFARCVCHSRLGRPMQFLTTKRVQNARREFGSICRRVPQSSQVLHH
jgi:hypothetical protein